MLHAMWLGEIAIRHRHLINDITVHIRITTQLTGHPTLA
jgi:hypothetical protein